MLKNLYSWICVYIMHSYKRIFLSRIVYTISSYFKVWTTEFSEYNTSTLDNFVTGSLWLSSSLCVVFDDRIWHSSRQVSSMWSTYLGTNVLQGHWCLVVLSFGRIYILFEVELDLPNDTFGGSESLEVWSWIWIKEFILNWWLIFFGKVTWIIPCIFCACAFETTNRFDLA